MILCAMLFALAEPLFCQVVLDPGTGLIPSNYIRAANIADWGAAGTQPLNGPEFPFPIPPAGTDANIELDKLINTLTTTVRQSPFVIKLVPGTYTFPMPIKMVKNMILRGAGACETTIDGIIQAVGASPAIAIPIIYSKDPSEVYPVNIFCPKFIGSTYNGNYTYVDNFDYATNKPKINVGDYCKINSQLFEITDAGRYKITFKTTLRQSFNISSGNCRLWREDWIPISGKSQSLELYSKDGVLENIGIENLKVSGSGTERILFNNCFKSWIKGVESDRCDRWHISLGQVYKILVKECFFKDAQSHDDGQGYGVCFSDNANDCAIIDNIFDHLRHGIVFQEYANGNVASHNFFTNNYKVFNHPLTLWNYIELRKTGDLTFHGGNNYNNLAQNNIGEVLQIDRQKGGNGLNNTMINNEYCMGKGILLASTYSGNIEIIDLYGRVVKKVFEGNLNTEQNQIEVDIQDLSRGFYQCRLLSKENAIIQKVILQ